ncbi:unnamed protein product [Brassica rapa]|uniref:Uncharacterized protein n=2 Tax=Brassica TaxID=3705 RepID=A0A3P6C3P8_BRACM|nr:unnamed protein product [Brassica napus]CAG7896972.1 unnamed protein product [Brassica rapa]CDY17053.1 BnaA08g04170D [Brassica napus]VDD03132.1 unnamed protein product [Brassica rapa]
MAVDDPLKPVVATKEAKPNYMLTNRANPQFLNRIRWSICGLSTVPLFIR